MHNTWFPVAFAEFLDRGIQEKPYENISQVNNYHTNTTKETNDI